MGKLLEMGVVFEGGKIDYTQPKQQQQTQQLLWETKHHENCTKNSNSRTRTIVINIIKLALVLALMSLYNQLIIYQIDSVSLIRFHFISLN